MEQVKIWTDPVPRHRFYWRLPDGDKMDRFDQKNFNLKKINKRLNIFSIICLLLWSAGIPTGGIFAVG